jgi:hypothetical protein
LYHPSQLFYEVGESLQHSKFEAFCVRIKFK